MTMILADERPLTRPSPTGAAPRAAHRILMADDDDDFRELICTRLRTAGYEVLAATDGSAALSIAQREHPDLLLLDVMMPGISGFEICRRTRTQSPVPAPPVILLTGKSTPEAAQAGAAAGARFYHRKPISFAHLLHQITTALGQAPPPHPRHDRGDPIINRRPNRGMSTTTV